MAKNSGSTARIFKALGDETRLQIIEMLLEGELCACKILERFHITQPTLSYHMKILTECGLVTGRREGTWIHYTLRTDTIEAIRDLLGRFLEPRPREQTACCHAG